MTGVEIISTIVESIERVLQPLAQGLARRRSIRNPVAALAEQEQIVVRIRSQLGRVDGLVKRVRLQTEHLREYRLALVTAAVTGKLDVARAEPHTDEVLESVAEGA